MWEKHPKTFIAIGTLLLIAGLSVWQWEKLRRAVNPVLSAYCSYCVRTKTIMLPRCDRVEVYHLDANSVFAQGASRPKPAESFHSDIGGEIKILGHVTLHGPDAEGFASLWRQQTFDPNLQKLCHSPVCGLQFYAGRKLIFQTTLCFHCSNFYATVPLIGAMWWGFDGESAKADELVHRLWILFPDAKPEGA